MFIIRRTFVASRVVDISTDACIVFQTFAGETGGRIEKSREKRLFKDSLRFYSVCVLISYFF